MSGRELKGPRLAGVLVAAAVLFIPGHTGRAAMPVSGDANARPNVIVLLVDDLGYADLSIQGSPDVQTPNIDSIAENGVRFTDGYVTAPVCTPSRGGLMTGRYQQRFGFEYNMGPKVIERVGLDLEQRTIADLLRPAGYATGMIGKWDLGVSEPYRPLNRGFDEFYGFHGGSRPHRPTEEANVHYNAMYRNTAQIEETGWSSDVYAEEAVDFIRRHREKPFFLFVSFTAPHWPMEAPQSDMDAYRHVEDLHRRTFLAMMRGLDRGVGEILACLTDCGLSEDTLVFFLSDNGGAVGPPRTSPDQAFVYGANVSRNDPFRGDKGQLYEGGIRVPFFLQWKGTVPQGLVSPVPVISLDIVATAVDVTGAPPPAKPLDGTSLMTLLQLPQDEVHDRPLYWRLGDEEEPLPWNGGNRRAIRVGDWKLVDYENRDPELYNLSQDPGEKRNLSAQRSDKLMELKAMLDEWDEQMEPPRWPVPGG